MDLGTIEKVLDTYSLKELLESNELSEAEVLLFLMHKGLVQLPELLPMDVEYEQTSER